MSWYIFNSTNSYLVVISALSSVFNNLENCKTARIHHKVFFQILWLYLTKLDNVAIISMC